ncbi:DUF418 domain-containing protein [Larkinella terrae]|uniref:DUF418 domain-containing protein n=1 Tax=Larkinella terrae TaxID=2025311 RepID=A0A7K0EKQ1_9BACT|nr:DUF418 domain-containing protein [Larkinella terrae]MRS62430.1 DUF418 domain-containing protein [Larkinella terrae]
MEAAQAPNLDQTAPGPRIGRFSTLDILRGTALLGILLVNIQAFGLTEPQIQHFIRGPHGGSYWLITLIQVLFGHSMQAAFTMAFGAGILLFLGKTKTANGMAAPELYIRRQMWLIAFGLINAIGFLWTYDLLFLYGIVGILLFPFRLMSMRTLLVSALAMGLIYSGKTYWNFTEQKEKYEKYQKVVALEKKQKQLDKKTATKAKKAALNDEQKDDKSAWEGLVKSHQYDKKQDESTIKAMRSDYSTVWSHLLPTIQATQAQYLYRLGLWDIASMILLGMALFRWGFYTDQLTTRQYTGLAAVGLLIGQALAWLSVFSNEWLLTDFTNYISTSWLPLHEVFRPFSQALSAVGWASLVMVLYRLNFAGWWWQAVGAVGQMGLTTYLTQSVACTLFFNGYGFGYFGQLRLSALYLIVAELWLLQIVFSVVWLRHFRLGPVEWLWKSLTTGQWQPLRRHEPGPESTPVLS